MTETYFENIFSRLNVKSTLITPNQRLSATLHHYYQRYQKQLGKTCWETPDILPLHSWLQRLWSDNLIEHFNSEFIVLNKLQTDYLWEQILGDDQESQHLLQLTETAAHANKAYNLLQQWEVTDHPLLEYAPEFKKWMRAFKLQCQQNKWLDSSSLANYISELIKQNKLHLPQSLHLYGFNEINPQLNTLLVTLKKNRVNIQVHYNEKKNKSIRRISCKHQDDEIYSIAIWAKQHWQQQPNSTIGCVIPMLDKIRDRVVQIFSEVFGEKDALKIDLQDAPFNISAGTQLKNFPIINTALDCLSLYKKNISLEIFNKILTSPFIFDAETEHVARAKVDTLFCKNNFNKISLHKILESNEDDIIQLILKTYTPKFYAKFIKFLNKYHQAPQQQNMTFWSNFFVEALQSIGWPGERSLESQEYQTVDHFMKMLLDLPSLDYVIQPIPLAEAYQILLNVTANTIFQPKTPQASIQVLGLLEAAAIPFDYLWVAGLDDLTWPPQPNPNPLLPKKLQRELQMPHASAERELAYCKRLMEDFKNNAIEIIYSYSQHQAELELQASALIRPFDEVKVTDLVYETYTSKIETVYSVRKLEQIIDAKAPPLKPTDNIIGGVSIIKNQALCPFKAFAENRLHAREIEAVLPGMRAKERGIILHKVLEIFWNKTKTHAALISLVETELSERIHECINDALQQFSNSHDKAHKYLANEKLRLYNLVLEWLQLEKSRESFTVLAQESRVQLKVNKLTLSTRVDRIDELTNGKKLIIDYKTNINNTINSWFDERINEPQLPLYFLLDPMNTIGITFAQLSKQAMGFKGISNQDNLIKGIKSISAMKTEKNFTWDTLTQHWEQVLKSLSNDFYNGVATVNPKDEATCNYCALKSLCRKNDGLN